MQPTITAEYLASQGLSKTFEKRFWKKVSKHGLMHPHNPALGHCWKWIGGKATYGSLGSTGAHSIKAHRGSWILHHGPIPEGQGVLHSCDNPRCTNPDHLFLGTPADNAHDRDKKGRQVALSGEDHGNCKLSWAQVCSIRELRATAKFSYRKLAAMFGVHFAQIGFIVRYEQRKTD